MLQTEMSQIEREEREENVKRIARAREYQQKLIMDKILLDAQRSKVLVAEKQKLMSLRGKTKEEAAQTKIEILAKFEKLRKRGIKKEDLKELGFDNLADKYEKLSQPDESIGHNSSIDRQVNSVQSFDKRQNSIQVKHKRCKTQFENKASPSQGVILKLNPLQSRETFADEAFGVPKSNESLLWKAGIDQVFDESRNSIGSINSGPRAKKWYK